MCQHKHEVDVRQKSLEFAARMRKELDRLHVPIGDLAELTGISPARLAAIGQGRAQVTGSEIRFLGLMLGIGMDELFPLDLSPEENRRIFEELTNEGVGLWAASGGKAPEAEAGAFSQEQLERCVVQLHHCAECLAKFPSSEDAD